MDATHNIYLIGNKSKGLYKIGMCKISKNPEIRLKELQNGCPFPLKIFKLFPSKYGSKLEKALHRRYAHQKKDQEGEEVLRGEWFCLSILDTLQFLEICQKTEDNIDTVLKDSTINDLRKKL